MEATTPMAYLRRELGFPGEAFANVLRALSSKDREDLKAWATEEMLALGIPVKAGHGRPGVLHAVHGRGGMNRSR